MAYGKLAEAYIQINADTTQFSKDLDKGLRDKLRESQREADNFGKRLSNAFGGGQKVAEQFRKALLPAVAALGAVGAAAFKAGQAASDLAEEQSKATQIFGDGAKQLDEFAASAAGAIGQSQRQALSAASTFGIFGKSAGLAGDDLVKFSQDFTVLASDLASFNNTTPDEAILAIGAALRGESEPIRRFGVLLDDLTLRNTALKMGIIDNVKTALTPQQKILAATEQIFLQTSVAQGDFARTSDGLANQQRILAAEFENAKASIGQAFLPVIQAAVGILSTFAKLASDNTGAVVALTAAIAAISGVIIAVNAGMRIYNAIATLTTGINTVLRSSFTKLQVGLGVLGGVIAVATVAYGLFASSKDQATASTEQLTEALKLEGDAQREALLAALEADPELRRFANFMRNEFGVTLEELNGSLGKNEENWVSYGMALSDAYKNGKLTFDQLGSYLNILEDMKDRLLATADAQNVLNGQLGGGKIPAMDLDKWYARQGVTMGKSSEKANGFGSSIDKAAQAMERMKQKVQQARTAIQSTFDRALSVANERLTAAREAFNAFSNEVASSIRSSLSFGQSQQDAAANADALEQALIAQADAQEAYNQAIMQPDMNAVVQAQKDLAAATEAVMDAQQRPMTFFDQLNAQANKATRFGELVQQLIGRGLSESALQQVLVAGVDAGTAIAEELLSGADNTLIDQANKIQETLDRIAAETGQVAAQRFRSQGVTMGEALVAGINEAISRVQIQLKSKGLTPKQIKKLQRDFAVEIGFNLSTGELPALANGAIVRRPTTALIGESGAEVVVPITRPARALELLEASGLASLARANGGAAVSIQNATFQQPTDIDLLAQKVNAAAIARSLTS